MRNSFGGYCLWCSKWVKPGDGFPERRHGHWRVVHASCVDDRRRALTEQHAKQAELPLTTKPSNHAKARP